MFTLRAENFDDAYKKLNNYLFFKNVYEYNKGGVTAHSFHNTLRIDTAECNLHMHTINYTIAKWKQLIKLYLDPSQLGVMCARLLHYMQDDKSDKYIPDIGMNFKDRRNVSGACLMGITVGFNKTTGWHSEVFTRASELTMRWYVDLIFVHVLLREIGKIIGFTPKDVTVHWHMATSYQSITSMPWFLVLTGQEQWLIDNLPAIQDRSKVTNWQYWTLRRYVKCYQNESYQSYRVQRRPAEAYRMLKGELEYKSPLWTHELTLPDIDINQKIEDAEEEDLFGKGGYR